MNKDIIVRVRTSTRAVRVRPGEYLSLNAKSVDNQFTRDKIRGVESNWNITYDELVQYVGTNGGLFRVRYAD